MIMKEKNCPCGRNKKYELCCELIHNDIEKAITAEDLMRSRYVAFTKCNGKFLVESHHTSTRQGITEKELNDYAKSIDWTRLEILSTTKGSSEDHDGTVEFKAYFKKGKKEVAQHEKSKFVREEDLWVYYGIEV